MKWFGSLLLLASLPALSFAQSTPPQDDAALSRLADSVLRDVATLRPGMPRSAVNRLFTEDGGLQTFDRTRYDYRPCRSIKIDIKFKSASNAGGAPTSGERADDIIVEVSRPYLEPPFAD